MNCDACFKFRGRGGGANPTVISLYMRNRRELIGCKPVKMWSSKPCSKAQVRWNFGFPKTENKQVEMITALLCQILSVCQEQQYPCGSAFSFLKNRRITYTCTLKERPELTLPAGETQVFCSEESTPEDRFILLWQQPVSMGWSTWAAA